MSDQAILDHPWMKKEDLSERDIAHVLPYMKKFNARRKFKVGVNAAIAAQKAFAMAAAATKK